jgi:hypothetical protein
MKPFTRSLYVALYFVLGMVVFSIFIRDPGINVYYRARVPDVIYGTAYRPFVYRALLPTTTRVLTAAIPEETRSGVARTLGRQRAVDRLFSKRGWEKRYVIEYGIALLLMYASLMGFVFALRYLCSCVFPGRATLRDLAPLLALACLPAFFRYTSYLYDFPTLLLFTLAPVLLLRGRWAWYMAAFVAACLNKETAILLVVLFWLHVPGRMERSRFLRLVGLQLVSFCAIKIGLFLVFRDNPGSFLEFHLLDHNLELLGLTPKILVWVGLALLLTYRWSEKPRFLKQGLAMLVPHFPLLLLFGWLDERRVFYEIYPVVVLLLAHTLERLAAEARPRMSWLMAGTLEQRARRIAGAARRVAGGRQVAWRTIGVPNRGGEPSCPKRSR